MSELAQRPRIGVTPPRQTMTRACQAPQCPMGWRSSPGRTMATRRAGTERGAAIRIRCRGANFVRRRAFCVWDLRQDDHDPVIGGLIWSWFNIVLNAKRIKSMNRMICPCMSSLFFLAWLVWCRALGAWHTAIPMTISSSRRLLKCGGWVPTCLSWCQSDYRVPRDPQNPVVNHGQSWSIITIPRNKLPLDGYPKVYRIPLFQTLQGHVRLWPTPAKWTQKL